MKRKFYYHPDNEGAVYVAVQEGKLPLKPTEEAVSCIYMPKLDHEGQESLGWWIEEYEPIDFMLRTGVFFVPAPITLDPCNTQTPSCASFTSLPWPR